MNDTPEKRGPGRPRKTFEEKQAERLGKTDIESLGKAHSKVLAETFNAAKPTAQRHKMKAKPNWENVDPGRDDTPDRLHIGQEEWPEGMAMQWITASVRGQEFPGRRMLFDQGGWTPVHQEDFDGKFNGRFMLRDAPGEITVEGLVLVARPIEFTERARVAEKRRAREQLEIKERAFRSGEIPNVSFDTKHESALRTNKISKSYERIDVPKDS